MYHQKVYTLIMSLGGWVPTFAVNILSRKLPKDFIFSLSNGCEVFMKKYNLQNSS
jgi:hypothetical protein